MPKYLERNFNCNHLTPKLKSMEIPVMDDSLGFSSMRPLMDQWDAIREDMDIMSQIRQAMDGQGLCFFFVKNGGVFGGPEDSRMSFARMKAPDSEEGDMEDGDFMGISLDDILNGAGQLNHRIFGKKDIDDLEILDQDSAAERVHKNHKAKKASEKKKK